MTARPAGVASALVAALAVLLYLPSLGNGFVWDDRIVLERQLPYFDGLLDAFRPPASIPQWSPHYYRPLVVLSYLVDDAIARAVAPGERRDGARRVVFHATPILLHGAASALVVAFAWSLLRRRDLRELAVASTAGILFAAHPVHAESVAWLAGRSDLLCAVFYLAAATAWLRFLDSRRAAWLGVSAALGFAAMLSKETGASLVLLLPLLDLLRRRDGAPPGWRGRAAWAVPAAALALYLALRALVLPASAGSSPLSLESWRSLPSALGWYVAQMAWPGLPSAVVANVPESAPFFLGGVASALLLGGVVAGGLFTRRAEAEAAAGALFLVGLSPTLAVALAPFIAAPLADRYLYLPSAGLLLLLALALARLGRGRAVAVLALAGGALLALAVPATLAAQRAWRSDLAFWTRAVDSAPESALAQNALGRALAAEKRLDEAEAHFRRAAALAGPAEDRARAHANLGALHAERGGWDEAVAEFRAAVAIAPAMESAHAGLAQALLARYAASPDPAARPGVMTEAERHLDAARRLDPRSPSLLYSHGMLLAEMARLAEAAAVLRELIALAPGSREAARARDALARIEASGGFPRRGEEPNR